MVKHGTYKLIEDTTVRFSNAVATFPKGHVIEVQQSDERNHKQIVHFGVRLVDWFYEGDVEKWIGAEAA